MNRLVERMIRAAKLDVALYNEVEHDQEAIREALLVVLLSGLAAGIGLLAKGGLTGAVSLTIGSLLGWFLWAYVAFLVGTKLLPEEQTEADYGQLLRTIGFSSSPGVIRVVGVIPGLAGPVNLVASIWMLVAMVVGVREALDYRSTFRAVLVCLVGWLAMALISGLIIALFG